MRQLIFRRTCEWLEIGYTYRAVRISYLVCLAEVAHIHIGYCKITTCYRARPDKRAQRCSVSSRRAERAPHLSYSGEKSSSYIYIIGERSEPHTYRTVGKNLRHIYIYVFYIYIYIRSYVVHVPFTRALRANVGPAG